MYRVGFVGVPSTGKSTLARALSSKVHEVPEFSRVELVNEYARRFITEYGPNITINDQFRFINKQTEWEDMVPQDHTDLIITDSPVHLAFMYSIDLCTGTKKYVLCLNDIFKLLNKITYPPRYDIIFHLPWNGIAAVHDGVRTPYQLEDSWRADADIRVRSVFRTFPPRHLHSVESLGVDDRVNECISVMKRLLLKK